MKYYLIEEIIYTDMEKLALFLRENGNASGLERLFWINLPERYLNEVQSGHTGCKPYVFAVELGAGAIRAELFVRTLKDMRCSCSGCSDKRQTQFIMRFMDEMIRKLEIRT
jgi:hypothetical protein